MIETGKQHEEALTPQADITVENCGSLFLFHAETQAGKEWINEHVPADATYFAGALVVEHRYAHALAAGMIGDGLRME